MRKPFVAGNWKMNKNIAETRELLSAMKNSLNEVSGVEKVVCPPFISLAAAAEMLAGSEIGLGAQNLYWEEKGAFTGEVAPAMVKELCNYVILGHSERRAYFGETDETVNKRLLAAQKFDLTPIVCVGETLAQYEANQTRDVVSSQTRLGLTGVAADFAPRIVVAYEPVWAIGTGKASTGEAANTSSRSSSARRLPICMARKRRRLSVCCMAVLSLAPMLLSSSPNLILTVRW
jgi:triosephosphate isomerase (TIM)